MCPGVLHGIEDCQKDESRSTSQGESDCRSSKLPLAIAGIPNKSPPLPGPELDNDGHIEEHDRERTANDEQRFQRSCALFDGSASALPSISGLTCARTSSEMSVIEPGSCSKCWRAW